MDLSVEREVRNGATVLTVVGEVDLWSADALRKALDDAAHDDPPQRAVVDLRSVGFLDSTGIGVLAGALRANRESAGDLVLVVGPGPVSKVLTVTGMDRVFQIFPDVAAATRGLAGA